MIAEFIDPAILGFILVGVMLFAIFIGFPISFTLIFAMTYEVLARKLFLAPTIWAYDISRFLYGALFMLGAGYALSLIHI